MRGLTDQLSGAVARAEAQAGGRAWMPRLLLVALLALLGWLPLHAQARVGDLVTRVGDVPRRIVGYGIVTGLDNTGDRSYGGLLGETPTVRSIVNLLKRFNVQVPASALQSRNAAAVIVTAEISPYLRAGGRFEVQVSSIGDASSLRGGILFMTPMLTDPSQPPIATAQGALLIGGDDPRANARRGGAGRIPDGGVLEVDPGDIAAVTPKLLLRHPDLGTATRIVAVINAAVGANSAKVSDPGSIQLTPQGPAADNLYAMMAGIDTLPVVAGGPARIVISARDGGVVAGGDVRVGAAAISHRGITLRIGAVPATRDTTQGMLALASGSTVQDVAAGLHAVGASSQEVASIFDALVQVGALSAQIIIR
jgi:flagellar P-ring protein precursor FlgI